MMNRMPLVSVTWLADKLAKPTKNIRVLDASWHLPNAGRNPQEEYKNGHIPNSLFFDVDGCADTSVNMAHMLPSPKVFEDYVGNLGINNDTHVILYDNNAKFGIFSAQRVWWTFKIFGHHSVSILEGGLPSWIQKGQAVSTAETPPVKKETFSTKFNPSMVACLQQIEENVEKKMFQLVDARPSGRFEGKSPEPRADIKPGHILNSLNLPFINLFDPDSRQVLPVEELKKLFKDAGVDLGKPLVVTCGSGMSACSLFLAAHLCGKDDVAVYDGSWTEFFQKGKPSLKINCPD